MNILIVSATEFEILPLISFLKKNFEQPTENFFVNKNTRAKILITGVGIPLTVFHLTKLLQKEEFDLILNAGIAGAFSRQLQLGEVVEVVSDRFGDLGVEEKDAGFTDVFELGLTVADEFPFEKSQLLNQSSKDFNFIKKASAITVNKVHGSEASIKRVREKYPTAEVESMEGAAVAMVCEMERVKYLQIRAISNYVEPRNRAGWKIEKSIENLNKILIEVFKEINI